MLDVDVEGRGVFSENAREVVKVVIMLDGLKIKGKSNKKVRLFN